LRRALRDLGYIEGQNLVVDSRGAEGDSKRFAFLVSELIALNPDVIVAETTPGVIAAKRATATIPIVMVNVTDPVGTGLVASLAHPGGNVTGGADFGTELATKTIELIRDVLPRASRLGILMSDNPVHLLQLEEVRAAAHHLDLRVVPFTMISTDQAEATFLAMVAEKVDAFFVLGGPPFDSTRSQSELIPALAAKARLPGVYPDRASVVAGGLFSYGTSLPSKWRLAAGYVDQILKGAKPADMPVQQPTTFDLVINRTTAARLGLTISPALLLQADKVVR
jgi:putative ABC transport system substrate-binding protein